MNQSDGYANVTVLFIQWDDELDELKRKNEAVELEEVFRERFKYTTNMVKLNAQKKPQHQLDKYISDFIRDYDGPGNLLIIYYSGYSVFHEDKKFLELQACMDLKGFSRNAKANWTRVEDRLRDKEIESDILIILDTCYAGNRIQEFSLQASKKFELVATAYPIDRKTTAIEYYSFTPALVDSLKESLSKHKGPISTFRLVQSINLNKHSDLPAHVWARNAHTKQHIFLAPLTLSQNSIAKPLNHSSVGGYLTLRFGLRDASLNKQQIEYMTKTLSNAWFNKALIGLRKVEWLDMKALPAFSHFDCVSLAVYAAMHWKKMTFKRKRERELQWRGVKDEVSPDVEKAETVSQKRERDEGEDWSHVKRRYLEPGQHRSPPMSELDFSLEGRKESTLEDVFDDHNEHQTSTRIATVSEADELPKDDEKIFEHDETSKKNFPVPEVPCQCSGHSRFAIGRSGQHVFTGSADRLPSDWEQIQDQLPDTYKWDIEYVVTNSQSKPNSGCWTCAPLEDIDSQQIPLTIAGAPVVIPVEHQWPPVGDLHPPPDPRPSALIDCSVELPLETIRDIYLVFEGSLGFYILISGFLQIIVEDTFDTTWASSYLPHKYGGLKVCYIPNTLEPTMLQSNVATASHTGGSLQTPPLQTLSTPRQSKVALLLQLNDFIEARVSSMSREKFSGRIGLKVAKNGQPFLIMSSHVITEAILSKSFFGLNREPIKRLQDDWNKHVELLAGSAKIGTIEKTYDPGAGYYPTNFNHDVTLIRPVATACLTDTKSPVADLGWLNRSAWSSLRQQASALKILGPTDTHRVTKCIKCNTRSETSIVGEGIFFNQTAIAGAKPAKGHDLSTWEQFVSRAVLCRVSPDFNPFSGHSGMALYAEGDREDGMHGPGIVGFQSFVQRSDHPQKFNMPEGPHLERRLKEGRVAFYGAFQVPDELRTEYSIL